MSRSLPLLVMMFTGLAASAQSSLQMVHDINTGTGSSIPLQTTVYNGALYFTADDGPHGRELWTYTGTGTPALVYDMNPLAGSGGLFGFGTIKQPMAVFNNLLFFQGRDSMGQTGLFAYDGINTPTLAPGQGGSIPSYLTVYGSKMYYVSGDELWSYDGLNAPVKIPVNTGTVHGYPYELTPFMGKIVFRGRNAAYGDELFAYDTVTATVSLVKDINVGTNSSSPQSLTVVNGKLYFFANDNVYGYELYAYDGTTTTRLTDMAPGAVSGMIISQYATAAYNNDLYFTGTSNGAKYDLFRWETATSDTTLVAKFGGSLSDGTSPGNFIVYNGKLYFQAKRSGDTTGIELWRTDGTVTEEAADICPGYCEGKPNNFCVFGNSLYFAATTPAYGYELYRYTDSPGTALNVQTVLASGQVKVYPNPARGQATLEVSLPEASSLSISLTDLSGRLVWSRGMAPYSAGKTNIELPANELSAGMYFYRVHSANGVQMTMGKMLVE